MSKFRKTAIAGLCSMAVMAMISGCSNDDKKKSPATSVQGVANKGIMKHARIEIFAIKDGVVAASPLASAVTDENGSYSASIRFSGPVLVVASRLDNTSTMVCDVAGGCSNGTVAFGDDFPMPATLQLKAVANVAAGSQSVNVTSLTHMAATLAEHAPVFGADAISAANSQVADLFELAGDITQFKPVNVADTSAFSAADATEQRNALLSAAIYAAADDKGMTLDDVADNFVGHNGQMLNDSVSTDEVDMAEILGEADDILHEPEYSAVDTSALSTELVADINQAQLEGENTTTSEPAVDALSPDMQKVQGMVADLRNIGVSTELEAQSEAFARENDIARQLLAEEGGQVRSSLALSLKAMAKLKKQRDNNPAITSPKTVTLTEEQWNEEIMDYQTVIVARIPVAFAGNEYTVNSKVNDVDVNLVATIDVAPEKTETDISEGTVEGSSTQITANEKLVITGSASNESVEFLISKGTAYIAFTSQSQETTDSSTGISSSDENLADFTVNLDIEVTMQQKKAVSGEVVITNAEGEETTVVKEVAGNKLYGHLTATIVDFDYTGHSDSTREDCLDNVECQDIDGSDYSQYEGNELETVSSHTEMSFKTIASTFIGKFDNDVTDNHISVNFAYQLNGNKMLVKDDTDEQNICQVYTDPVWGDDEYCYPVNEQPFDESDFTLDETTTNFLSASYSLDVVVDLAGISDETSIHIGGERTSLETSMLNGEIAFDGKRYTIEMPVDRKEVEGEVSSELRYLKVTNHNNVVLTITPDENDKPVGEITMNGVKFADITKKKGLTFIRYTNGQFETLE